jgi:hypothetical protein
VTVYLFVRDAIEAVFVLVEDGIGGLLPPTEKL